MGRKKFNKLKNYVEKVGAECIGFFAWIVVGYGKCSSMKRYKENKNGYSIGKNKFL